MEFSEEQIKEAIADGRISAISLDTSVFDGNGNRFEHGLLARMRQFDGTAIDVVLSDVIIGEVKAHVIRDAVAAQSKVRASMKEVSKSWQVSDANRNAAMSLVFGEETPEQLAQRRVDAFTQSASVQVIESEGRARVADVLAAYFSAMPPFGKTVAKKSEFPDAIALQALEHWAKHKNILLLVVSKDGDWQRYCKNSPRLVPADDLANALSFFHQNAEVACARLIDRLNSGKLLIDDDIKEAIRNALDRLVILPEASSAYYYESDVYDIDVPSISISVGDDGLMSLKVVDKPDEEELVVEAEVEATVAISSSFQFSVTDPIDKDEVSIGSASATKNVSIDIKVLLTFQGDLAEDAELVHVEVDLGDTSIDVDYGEVGPNWDPDPDDD